MSARCTVHHWRLLIAAAAFAGVQAFSPLLSHNSYNYNVKRIPIVGRSAAISSRARQQQPQRSLFAVPPTPPPPSPETTAAAADDEDATVDAKQQQQQKERQQVYFNGTSDGIIPIMFDPAIAAAGADALFSQEDSSQQQQQQHQPADWMQNMLSSYWGPRVLLAVVSAVYGTNFALGSLMNGALPASAVTAARMTLAAAALAPFAFQIRSSALLRRAVLTGCCTAAGYVAQSLALVDTDPARVSFLGAATVLWLPLLEAGVDKVPMGWRDAPQTWMAAGLCLLGVGVLELYDPAAGGIGAMSGIGTGDLLALLQAVGFGTGVFLSAKMVREQPDQVLPVTSVLIATTAVLAWIWCLSTEGAVAPLLQLVTDGMAGTAPPTALLLAILWTGLVSTSLNFVAEIAALGHVPSSEAAVLLASEPVWAAVFAAALLGETLGLNDYIGGACIICACLVNALVKPSDVHNMLRRRLQPDDDDDDDDRDDKNNKESLL